MPRNWVEKLCQNVEHLRGALVTVAEVADVSISAAALRILKFGPPGYIVAHCRDNIVTMIGQTKGTRASIPEKGINISDVKLSAFEEPKIFGSNNSICYIWKERDTLLVPDRPANDWRTILAGMLSLIPEARRAGAHSRINAIVGYRLGKHPVGTDAAIVYKDVVKAFENRTDRDNDVADLRRHPDFENYVLARIYERAHGQ